MGKFISERNYRIISIFEVQIWSCGISTLWKAKSSIQDCQAIMHTVSACFLLMRNTAARIRSRKSKKNIGKQRHLILTQINKDSQKISQLAKKLCNNNGYVRQYSSSFVHFCVFSGFAIMQEHALMHFYTARMFS